MRGWSRIETASQIHGESAPRSSTLYYVSYTVAFQRKDRAILSEPWPVGTPSAIGGTSEQDASQQCSRIRHRYCSSPGFSIACVCSTESNITSLVRCMYQRIAPETVRRTATVRCSNVQLRATRRTRSAFNMRMLTNTLAHVAARHISMFDFAPLSERAQSNFEFTASVISACVRLPLVTVCSGGICCAL